MIKKTGINGIDAASNAAQTTRQDQLEADVAYIEMMSGIDIPTEEAAENE